MASANSNGSNSQSGRPALLPPLTINDNEHESKAKKKRNVNKKRLVVAIGRSNLDPFIDKDSLILVRDPPRERLARSRVSAEEQLHEETLLSRISGKQDAQFQHDYPVLSPASTTTTSPSSSCGTNSACTTPCNTTASITHRLSQEEEYYADIYQYYYDVTKPPSRSPSPPPRASDLISSSSRRDKASPSISAFTPRPENRSILFPTPAPLEIQNPPPTPTSPTMSKKRGSLQSIFVPSFLQSAIGGTTPPLTPEATSTPSTSTAVPGQGHGTVKYASRMRALSAAGSQSKASHGSANAISNSSAVSNATSEGHQRKRSMTFSMSMSLSMASSLHSPSTTSFITSPPFVATDIPSVSSPSSPSTTPLSPRSSPPPAFLIDDDPFANLTSAPSESMGLGRFHHHPHPPPAPAPVVVPLPPPPIPIPRSPLHESPVMLPSVAGAISSSVSSDMTITPSSASTSSISSPSSLVGHAPVHLPSSPIAHNAPSASTSTLSLTTLSKSPSLSSISMAKSPVVSSSSLSSSSVVAKTPSLSAPSSPPAPPPQRARPAHQRPAFSPRPSLPSLDTLARMNVVLTKKVRKGRVGAGLPFEPWDLPSDDEAAPPPPPPSASASNSSFNVPNTASAAAGPVSGSNAVVEPTPSALVQTPPVVLSKATPSSPPLPTYSSNSTVSPPTYSPALSTMTSPIQSRAVSPSPLLQPPHPTSSTPSVSTSPSMRSPSLSPASPSSPSSSSSSASFTPPATATTFASAPTSGYHPPPPPAPMHPPPPPPPQQHAPLHLPPPTPLKIARPQPLLPSQILALGSIAADVEMVVPVSGYPGTSWKSTSSPTIAAPDAPLQPLSNVAGPTRLPVVEEAEPPKVSVEDAQDVVVQQEAEEEGSDGYFGDFLDRYQHPSRACSEDGHGVGNGSAMPIPVDDGLSHSGLLAVAAQGATVDRNSFTEEYSYLGKLVDDNTEAEVEGPGVQSDVVQGLAMFSSPPLSTSLNRSFSTRSDSSMGSIDSASAVEQADTGDDRAESKGRIREERWSYRRFVGPSRSLSSLELDMDGESVAGSGHDAHSAESDWLRGDGTHSSSSHPSLSRTRSLSDDSDMVQSPTPGDYDYTYYPYSHARALASTYQAPRHSALFAPNAGPGEDESLFHTESARHAFSSSSSVEDVREAGITWDAAFITETDRGVSMPEGLTELTDGDGGYGFGFDKVIVAEEVHRDVVVGKEKESLTTATSVEVAHGQPTSTVPRAADLPSSSSSSDQHDLSLSASTNLSPVEPGISPLVSESDSNTQLTSLTSDDELMSRSNALASGHPLRYRTTTMRPRASGEPNDSTGYRSRGHSAASSISQSYKAGSSHAQQANSITSNAYYYSMGSRDYRGVRRRGDSDDEDGEEEKRRRRALERTYVHDSVSKITSHSSSDDDSADNYGEISASSSKNRLAPRANAGGSVILRSPSVTGSFVTASSRSPSLKPMDFPASSKHSSRYASEDESEDDDSTSDSDDDVPLAQRIPGALTAQQTIRRQFREEREQRKREKALRMENGNAERRARQETLRPAGAGPSMQDGNVGSSSRDAAMHAASSVSALQRQRTTTLPGKAPTAGAFNPHDLARKLQNVQLAEASPPAYQQQQLYLLQQQHQQLALRQRSKSVSKPSADHQPLPPYSAASPSASSPATRSRSIRDPSTQTQHQFSPSSPMGQTNVPPVPSLRPMRSFHRPSEHRSVGVEDPRTMPHPSEAEQRLGRSVTSATRSHRPVPVDDPRFGADADPRLGRSVTSATRAPRRRSPSQSRPGGERSIEPVPPLPASMHGRTSHDDPRKNVRPGTAEGRNPSTRTSGDVERAPRSAPAQPPLPPLANKVVVSQQRVFVGNLQQFHMVEIGPTTTAGDIVSMMEAQGALNGWAGSGGWMVFEVAQDFGMERPVRSYELLADVQSSWLKDKSVNYFVLRLTPLAVPLNIHAIPTSSPTHSGYIEWEVKRGKWSKRWLHLREHNLYLAKRDNGKDEVLICSLSNFDAYTITRHHRAPKPFAFAVKSTDNLSFFENTADYMHTFSCNEKDGQIWIEKILVARSYVLHQERHILFNPKTTGTNGNSNGAAVSRAGTKKYTPVRSNQQPLVSLPPIGVAQSLPHHDVFEPGSLLAKH
ncbi:hypothetical protein JR316_0007430 [Psilocybe cubensis]|uniref:Uncharacterized protein n=2 Tax=Psilocybe cubensis TaxID=181762 RepID=A0ACB8H0P7_PSICU|nr:hypothetical protein JR316_0007430 [Psilocybe cubensis]KAH9480829.1 hypothetical protein JR316_0007430 [Psilocybe cubensis]